VCLCVLGNIMAAEDIIEHELWSDCTSVISFTALLQALKY